MKVSPFAAIVLTVILAAGCSAEGSAGSSSPKGSSPSDLVTFDFKGLKLGAPVVASQVEATTGVECGAGFKGLQVCNGKVTVARQPAVMNMVIGTDANLQRINLTFQSSGFDDVHSELRRKFGAPSKTEEGAVQTRTGAVFPRVTYRWVNPEGMEVRLTQYITSLDDAELNYSTAIDRQLLERNRETNRSGDI